jgi:hypothetical protein
VEVASRLEITLSLSSQERNTFKSGHSSYPLLLYECILSPQIIVCMDYFSYDKVLVGA